MTVVQRSPEAGIQGLAGHSSRESSTPSVDLLGRHPHPAVNPFVEAATAYRHAREGGHPGVRRGTRLGRHPHPAVNLLGRPPYPAVNPFGRPPQPTVMPAKAGIQGESRRGALSREASTPCRQPPWRGHPYTCRPPLREAATAYRHARERRPLNNRHSREGGNPGAWRGTLSGGIHTLRQPPWEAATPAVNPFVEAATAYRHARERRPSGGHRPSREANPGVRRGTPPWRGIHTCRQPLRGGRHSLPSCPRRRASRVWGALVSGGSKALAQGRSNSLPKFHESKRPEGLDKA